MNEERFGGIQRLYGTTACQKIEQSRIAIIGIGGVGSWVAEALARSGVGQLILMDMDELCVTNTNRQIHALDGCYGKLKVEVMKERLLRINPDMHIDCLCSFYKVSQPEELFAHKPDIVIDAIDSMRPKAHLIASCYERKIPVISCGGAGGRIDASQIRMSDISRTSCDNMLSQLRKQLRQDYQVPLHDKCPELGIPCVYSTEKPRFPRCDGSVSLEREKGQLGGIGCANGFGSATHITATFGMMMASRALQMLSESAMLSQAVENAAQENAENNPASS